MQTNIPRGCLGNGRAGGVDYEDNEGAFWVMDTFIILIVVMFNRYIHMSKIIKLTF